MTSVVRRVSVLVVVVVSSALAALAVLGACTTSDLNEAPPDSTPRLCEPGVPVVPCDAGPPNALGACTGDPAAVNNVRLLPLDKSYPVGCRGYFPARDCTALDNCYCRADDGDAGTARWVCER